jgi:hypothetical protein
MSSCLALLQACAIGAVTARAPGTVACIGFGMVKQRDPGQAGWPVVTAPPAFLTAC